MSIMQTEQLRHITVRWAQAHQRRNPMDWHAQTKYLMTMASNAMRIAESPEDREFASDLYLLAGLSYYRSLEFAPPDLSRLPNLICETA